uniref:dipeptidase 1-like n=1 Tax=Ciona intestinalis TaxID=7719 RepID=UPI000521C65E|nr:dipeptidase 1-like [Ciona intestinalis]XP_026689758.1 dipeptidase 1-like [Ciona intestinalis]|eukprot:XP_009858054.1 dipeptidase 1-like [Ciona intestinalis]
MGSQSNNRIFIFLGAFLAVAVLAVVIAVPLALSQNNVNGGDAAINILTEVPIIDGHNDWPYQLRRHLQNKINDIDFMTQNFSELYNGSHTDVPRMKIGKMGAQFWSCYCACAAGGKDAVRLGIEQIDVVRRYTEANPLIFQFTTTADEIMAANKEGKIACLIGIEGGHMIDSSLAALRTLFNLGTRYMTLTHSCDTPWATAFNTNKTTGLTSFGKLVVAEMNRLGMLVDLAHVSDMTMNDVFDVTTAPVIYSHSSARALCDHGRNVPDDILKRLAENKGILMVNFYNDYVTCSPKANISNVADHFDYVKNLIGADYLGMGADYDGVPRVPEGLEDVSTYPNLIRELLSRGWATDDLKKISGGNILRVMRAVEDVAKQSSNVSPGETWIPDSEVASVCRTPA